MWSWIEQLIQMVRSKEPNILKTMMLKSVAFWIASVFLISTLSVLQLCPKSFQRVIMETTFILISSKKSVYILLNDIVRHHCIGVCIFSWFNMAAVAMCESLADLRRYAGYVCAWRLKVSSCRCAWQRLCQSVQCTVKGIILLNLCDLCCFFFLLMKQKEPSWCGVYCECTEETLGLNWV